MLDKKNAKIIILVATMAVLLWIINIRVCILYSIFKIPCVGCGLTRAVMALFRLRIRESIQYNILGIPVFVAMGVYLFLDMLNKTKIVDSFLKKNIKMVVVVSTVLVLVTWYININNPLLYE